MKIAVIGSGISGLSSAFLLSQRYEVELFESDARLGGHAHTVNVMDSSKEVPVDTGFLVYNELTYPHFIELLKFLKVETADSDMSLSIQSAGGLEWAGTNLSTVFSQKKNLLNPAFIKMLLDILKFHRQADENLILSRKNKWNLQQLIQYRGLSQSFVNWYLLPMTGAIWSMSFAKSLEFPAETFLQFCSNHRLLQVNDRPVWKTIKNGSINYVNRIKEYIPKIHLNTPVLRIEPRDKKLIVHSQSQEYTFDKVVLATSAPISYQMLVRDLPLLAASLKNAKTSENKVELHRDESVMPLRKKCWSSWNVDAHESHNSTQPIGLTYYLNKLQPLQTEKQLFITLNSSKALKNVERTFTYHHPQLDREMIQIQELLLEIQGQSGVYFAGAWTRYGFHEDGILSAVKVAELLEVKPPWKA